MWNFRCNRTVITLIQNPIKNTGPILISKNSDSIWRQKSYFSLTYACNASVPKNTSNIAHQSFPNGTAEKLLYSLVCPITITGLSEVSYMLNTEELILSICQ